MIKRSFVRAVQPESIVKSSRTVSPKLYFSSPRRFASSTTSDTKDTVLRLSELLANRRLRLLEQVSLGRSSSIDFCAVVDLMAFFSLSVLCLLPLQQTSPDGSDDVERSKLLKELEPVHRAWSEWKAKEKVRSNQAWSLFCVISSDFLPSLSRVDSYSGAHHQ